MGRERSVPRGIYITADDWRNGSLYMSPDYDIRFQMEEPPLDRSPKSIYDKIHWRFDDERRKVYPPAFVSVLKNARVFGSNGSVITSNNHLFFELSYEYGKNPEEHSIFNWGRLPKLKKKLREVAVIAFTANDYYYHWVFDVLCRLHLLELSQRKYDKLIINNRHDFKFQDEMLALLGVDANKLLTCYRDFHIQAESVIVPSLVGYTGHMPKWACDYLRSKFLRFSTKVSGSERLFIGREHARHRKLLNEEEVLGVLKEHGFKKVILEHLSITEQINLFSSAEAIVAPHGGGLTNIVFCNPNTKVIELFSPNYVNVLYWILSHHVNIDYYYLIGEGEVPPDYVDPHLVSDDIVINIEKLRKTLDIANL